MPVLACALGALPTGGAEGRTVRVGVYQNRPKVFVSEDGKPQGIFVDLIEAIAEREGWSVEYVPGLWAEGLDRLTAEAIDLMTDVALTPEREQEFAFHREPVLSDWFQIYARRNSGIRSLVDLHGKRVAVLDRSAQQTAFSKLVVGFDITAEWVPLADYSAAFEAVVDGTADAVIVNRFYAAGEERDPRIEDTAIIFNPTRLFFAAPLTGDPALHHAIDRHLAEFKRDPDSVYYHSLRRWSSEPSAVRFPLWLKAAGPVLGGLLLLFLTWSVSLRHQVAVRTRALARRNQELLVLFTEKQSAERALRELNASLEKRVLERTGELAVARDRAEAADRLKSAFLATMSHELRTPLNSIIGFTGILLQELAGPLSPEQAKQLGMVRDSGRHLLALINDVLDLSKIEAGEMTLHYETFPVRELVDHVAELVAPMAEKKGLELEVRLGSGIGMLSSDRQRIEQVLLNLLNNAIKFTEKGSVALRVEREGIAAAPAGSAAGTAAQATRPSAGRPAARLRFAVVDTGMGIRSEDLGKLFLPFRQVDSGLSRKHEGTGLGLAICRRLVGLLGGEIGVASEWGKGSTFFFHLPLEGESA